MPKLDSIEPTTTCLDEVMEEDSSPTRPAQIQKQAIEYLNPGQVPVTTFDQPLLALAKYV